MANKPLWIRRIISPIIDKAVSLIRNILFGRPTTPISNLLLKEDYRIEKINETNKQIKDLEIDNENLRFLLGHKLSYLTTVSIVCMSWWVSSIVFCGSIIAAVWYKRADLVEPKIIIVLGVAVTLFFASFIRFGNAIDNYLTNLKADIVILMEKLRPADPKMISTDIFEHEIEGIKKGIRIGIHSFILILFVWIILIIVLYHGYWNSSRM
jgi:hypothetical protein